MSSKAVFRVAPVSKSGLSGAKKHQLREFEEPHIDTSRSHLNMVLVGSGDVEADVLNFVAAKGVKPRGETIAAEMILTAAASWFEEEKVDVKAWAKANIDALKKKWGDRLVSANLHMDEMAPHIHAFVVPVSTHEIATGRGGKGKKTVTRLSYSREFSDDKKTLEAARLTGDTDKTKCGRLQTWYALEMQTRGFNLERGVRNSRATHQAIKQFQTAVSKLDNSLPPPPKLADVPRPETVKKIGLDTGFYSADAMHAYAAAAMKKGWDAGVEVGKTWREQAAIAPAMKHKNTALELTIRDKDALIERQRAEIEKGNSMIDKLTDGMLDTSNSLSAVKNDAAMAKKEVDALMRATPPDEVLRRLGYEFSTAANAWKTEVGAVRITGGKVEIEGWKERQPRNAVDLVMAVRGVDFAGALGVLKVEVGIEAARNAAVEAANAAKAPSPLPAREESRYGAVRRYLEGRGIPGPMVDELHNQQKLYADDKAACVFVLGDGEGCEMRGTVPLKGGEAFKGTRGAKALFVLPAKATPKAVVYVESAIDALSYRALWGDEYTVVGTGGQNKTRLIQHAKKAHAEGVPIIAAFDADDKGGTYHFDLMEAGITALEHRPISKDWNGELRRCTVAGVRVAGNEPAPHPLERRPHPAEALRPRGFSDIEGPRR